MAQKRDFQSLVAFLALALAFGGAGLSYPLLEMVLELAALCLLTYLALTRRVWRFNRPTRLALLLLLLILVFPLCQLVPLPPAAWQALPGRDSVKALDALIGWSPWRPVTLDVEGTMRSFLRLLPAAAMFVGCLFLPTADRGRLLLVLLGFALVGAVLGVVQLATGGLLTPYRSGHAGYPIGLFVNRNHNAAFMIASMPILGAVAAAAILRGRRPFPIIMAALSALLILTVVVLGTTSRMALALLPLGIGAFLFILFRRRSPFKMVLPSIAAVAALLAYLLASGGFTRTLSRFSSLDDSRFHYWADVSWALQHYGLAGTGFGTFVPVYKSAESLSSISPPIVNHAHNDYLEVILEGGVAGIALLLLFLGLLAMLFYRASRAQASGERALNRTAAAAAVILLLLASAVDYPLRMPALSVALAVLCAVLLPTKGDAEQRTGRALVDPSAQARESPLWLPRAPLLLLSILLGVICVQAAASAHALAKTRYADAARWAWWSTRAHEGLATKALLQGRPTDALAEARTALRLSPINAASVRTAGLVELAQRSANGGRLMQAATTLGWRDPLTQLWAIDAAERSLEPQKALQRAEALFAQDALVTPAIAQLLGAPPGAGMTRLLAGRLAERPGWRSTFLADGANLPERFAPAFAEVVLLLQASKAPVSAAELEPALQSLVEQGRVSDAQRLWALVHRRVLITNGSLDDFDSGRRPPFPAGWDRSRASRARVTLEAAGGARANRALRIAGPISHAALEQVLMLAPGPYGLAFDVRLSRPSPVTLGWELRCVETGRAQVQSITLRSSPEWLKTRFSLSVPDQDCRIQALALTRIQATDDQQIWVDNIELESAAH